MRRVPRLPSGMMHCHVRPKAGSTVEDKRWRERGQSWVEAGCPRSHWRPPSRKPQVTRKSSGSYSARNSFKNVLATFPLLWPLSLTLSYSTHSSPLTLLNVPQPAKHNELLHLRSRCSIKSVLPPATTFLLPLPPNPLHSLFAQFQFHCPFPSRTALHFPFSALLFFISSKVSRLMFWVAASQWQFPLPRHISLIFALHLHTSPCLGKYAYSVCSNWKCAMHWRSWKASPFRSPALFSFQRVWIEIKLFKYPLNKALMKWAWQCFQRDPTQHGWIKNS